MPQYRDVSIQLFQARLTERRGSFPTAPRKFDPLWAGEDAAVQVEEVEKVEKVSAK
jgi:hypothetical protein